MRYTEQDKQTALHQLLPLLETLPKDRRGKPICPYCGSGSGKHGTSEMQFNENTASGKPMIYCHVCGKSADAIDLYKFLNNCDFSAAVVALSGGKCISPASASAAPGKEWNRQTEAKPRKDYTKMLNFNRHMLHDLNDARADGGRSYLSSRHISLATAKAFKIGFNPSYCGKQVIIIPTLSSPYGFTYREIFTEAKPPKEAAQEAEAKPRYMWRGDADISADADALKKPVFCISEGIFDIMSVYQTAQKLKKPRINDIVGFFSLNSVNNTKILLKHISKLAEKPAVIGIILDDDKPGRQAAAHLAAELARVGIFSRCSFVSGYKDASEALKAGADDAILKAFFEAMPSRVKSLANK